MPYTVDKMRRASPTNDAGTVLLAILAASLLLAVGGGSAVVI